MPEPLDPRERTLAAFAAHCAVDDRVLAAFVGGSFATGRVDAFSDLDLYVLIRPDAYDDFLATHRAFFAGFATPVFLEHFDGFGFDMLVFILEDGVQGELGLARPERFRHIHGGPHRVLVDKAGLLDGVTFPWQQPGEDEQRRFLWQEMAWFWRDLSLYAVAVGRGQPWTAAGCLESMRRRCLNLFRLDREFTVWADGYEKLERAVPAAVLAPLERSFAAFTPGAMAAAADSLIHAYRHVAPDLARRHGFAYPEALEAVARQALARARQAQPPP